jgi:hypothetical protein
VIFRKGFQIPSKQVGLDSDKDVWMHGFFELLTYFLALGVLQITKIANKINPQHVFKLTLSNPEIKKKIRIAAEEEEKISYESQMNEEWKNDLAALQTNWEKPFLEIAPYLIIVFSKSYSVDENQNKQQNYYVKESCGIACGILLAAIHHAGLAALTHTPSPMNFLNKILDRPQNEKPFLLIPVGYLAKECYVPCLERKPLNEISAWY